MSRVGRSGEAVSQQADRIERQQQDHRKNVGREVEQIQDLFTKVRARKLDLKMLRKLDFKALTQEAKAELAKIVGKELKGLLPAQLYEAAVKGDVDEPQLQKLIDTLIQQFGDKGLPRRAPGKAGSKAKTTSPLPQSKAGSAASKGEAPSTDQLAKGKQATTKWQQYAQTTGMQKHVSTGRVAQKILKEAGEKKNLLSVLSERNGASGKGEKAAGTAGMRSPVVLHKEGLQRFSPKQQAAMLQKMFGRQVMGKLSQLGVRDLAGLLATGASPEGRAELAKAMGVGRGALLTSLLGSELLGLGPGGKGEMGISPEMLGQLARGGVFSLSTLAALKGLPRGEFHHLFSLMRHGPGAFRRSMRGDRPLLKKDLNHWSQRASRTKSRIILADPDELEDGLDPDEGMEHVTAWYLEALFYEELEEYRWLLEREREREERERQQEEDRQRQEDEEERQSGRDDPLLVHPDPESPAGLVCFWIEEHNLSPRKLGGIARRYVCIDPRSGAIIPKGVEGGDTGGYIDLATRTDGYTKPLRGPGSDENNSGFM